MKDACVLISSCESFSDLWDENIALLKKNWQGRPWKTYLLTDEPTDKIYNNINIISAGKDKNFPMRIKYALEKIDSEYILLTLDDYFVIDRIYEEKLSYLVERMESDNIDYLKLYDRRITNPKKYSPLETITKIDLSKKYAVTLYPAIWKKSFLINSVKDDTMIWKYEVGLTKYASESNANCMFSCSGVYNILDVVRKGKVLNKANKYFKKNKISIGSRPIISRSTEFKLAIMDWASWHMPREAIVFIKKILKKFGFTFYSED